MNPSSSNLWMGARNKVMHVYVERRGCKCTPTSWRARNKGSASQGKRHPVTPERTRARRPSSEPGLPSSPLVHSPQLANRVSAQTRKVVPRRLLVHQKSVVFWKKSLTPRSSKMWCHKVWISSVKFSILKKIQHSALPTAGSCRSTA